MGPGDYVDIPAHRKYRAAWTTPDEPTIWLVVYYGSGEKRAGRRTYFQP
jgi:cupin 2 domain-containing protein